MPHKKGTAKVRMGTLGFLSNQQAPFVTDVTKKDSFDAEAQSGVRSLLLAPVLVLAVDVSVIT